MYTGSVIVSEVADPRRNRVKTVPGKGETTRVNRAAGHRINSCLFVNPQSGKACLSTVGFRPLLVKREIGGPSVPSWPT